MDKPVKSTKSEKAAERQAAEGRAAERHDRDFFSDPDRFINREFSWLEFNRRVLEEAEQRQSPLLERVRFLSISANNLDEFFMVRVAGLEGQVRQGVERRRLDGMTPREQLTAVARVIAESAGRPAARLAADCAAILPLQGSHIVGAADCRPKDHSLARERIFSTRSFPVLTPLAIDPAHPFPFIPNLGFSLVYAA